MPGKYTYLACDLITGRVRERVRLIGVTASLALDQATPGTFSAQLALADLDPVIAQSWRDACVPDRSTILILRDGVVLGEWCVDDWPNCRNDGSPIELSGTFITSYFAQVIPVFTGAVGDLPAFGWVSTEQLSIAAALAAQAADPIPGSRPPAGSRGLALTIPSATASGQLVDRTDWPGQNKTVLDMHIDLAGAASPAGFDWTIRTTLVNGYAVRTYTLGYPRLGIDAGLALQPAEGKPGGNAINVDIPQDGARLATQVIGLGAGAGLAQVTTTSANTGLIGVYPLRQRLYADTSILDETVLQAHTDAKAAGSRTTEVPPAVQVFADKDPVLGSYNPGDYFTLSLGKSANFPNGYKQKYRLTGMTINPPKAGRELVTLTLADVQES